MAAVGQVDGVGPAARSTHEEAPVGLSDDDAELLGVRTMRPHVAFDRGLAETVEWYKSNAAWVAAIRNKDYLSYYEKQYGKL